jgi:hypothetical protein
MTKIIAPPKAEMLSPYQANYIQNVQQDHLLNAFEFALSDMQHYLENLDEDHLNYRYAEGKWTVREVLRHLVESEMIFGYRALRFSRMDKTPLSGYDENAYIKNYSGIEENKAELFSLFRSLREFNIAQFAAMNDDMLDWAGQANGHSVTARIIGYMIAGHQLHHLEVLRTRYHTRRS